MDIEEACPCDSPEYWEVLKSHFEDQTMLLRGKERELREKIAQVESLIASHSSSICSCDIIDEVPRVFPRNDSPVKPDEKCSSSFFQKVMENAKSILAMKCSSIHPSTTNEIPTRDSSCACDTDDRQWTSSSSKGVAFESLPSFDEDDPATRNDTTADSYSQEVNNSFSCTCGKEDTTISTGECSQRTTTSISKTPFSFSTGQYTNPASIVSCGCPSNKLPEYPDVVTRSRSTAMSGDDADAAAAGLDSCWNNPFKCRKSDDPPAVTFHQATSPCDRKENIAAKSVFSRGISPVEPTRKRDACCRICPSTKDTTTSRGSSRKSSPDGGCSCPARKKSACTDACPRIAKRDACCRICPSTRDTTTSRSSSRKASPGRNDSEGGIALRTDCPKVLDEADTNTDTPCTVDTCTSLIQQKQTPTCCKTEHFSKPKNAASRKSVGDRRKSACVDSTCPRLRHVSKSFTSASIAGNRRTEKRKSCTIQTCPSKRIRSRSNIRDEDNQCAFIGSPILNPSDYRGVGDTKTTTADCCCATSHNKIPQKRAYKDHMRELMEKDKYDSIVRNIQNTVNQPTCCCAKKGDSKSDIKMITDELKMENQILKGEVLEMKYELKHCIENIEGPIKQKLQTERLRCEHLQKELDKISQNMIGSQDSHLKETNCLKLQLCLACSNMTELNSINKRLKEEMKSLDTTCAKLEEDLLKQKLNEADTIRRLTKRANSGGASDCQCGARKFSCDSSLNVIARKLSKTLKESAPCEECSKHPELTGAAKIIKDLTDMVEQRKTRGFSEGVLGSKKDCSCQSRQTEEDSCQCNDVRDIGAGESRNLQGKNDPGKMTKTLFPVPPTFVEKNESSNLFNFKGNNLVAAEPQISNSRYYSAHGEPDFQGTGPCSPCPEACGPPVSSHPAGDPSKDSRTEKQQQIPERTTKELEPCLAPCGEIASAPCVCIGKPCQTVEIETRDQDQGIAKEDRSEQIPVMKTTGSSTGEEGQIETSPEISSVCSQPCGDDAPCDEINKPCQTVEVEKTEAESGEEKLGGGGSIKKKETCDEETPCEPCVSAGRPCPSRPYRAPPTVEEIVETIRRESISSAHEAVERITNALLSGIAPIGSDVGAKAKATEEPVGVGGAGGRMGREESSARAARMVTDALLDNVSERHQKTEIQEEIKPPDDIKESPLVPDSKPTEQEQVVEETIDEVTSDLSEQQKKSSMEGKVEEAVDTKPSEQTEKPKMSDDIEAEGDRKQSDGKIEAAIEEIKIERGSIELAGSIKEEPITSPIIDTAGPTPDSAAIQEQPQNLPVEEAKVAPGELISEEMQGEFPLEVETTVAALVEPPAGLLVTTTITKSGNLEVITEGPHGVIETALNYTEDGVIEVVTQITETDSDRRRNKANLADFINESLSDRSSGSKKQKSDQTNRSHEGRIQFEAEPESTVGTRINDSFLSEDVFEEDPLQFSSEKESQKETLGSKTSKTDKSSDRKDTTASMITQYSQSIGERNSDIVIVEQKSLDNAGEVLITQVTLFESSADETSSGKIIDENEGDVRTSKEDKTTPGTSTNDSVATPEDATNNEIVTTGTEDSSRSGQPGIPANASEGRAAQETQGPGTLDRIDDEMAGQKTILTEGGQKIGVQGSVATAGRDAAIAAQKEEAVMDQNADVENPKQEVESQKITDGDLKDQNAAMDKSMQEARSQGVTDGTVVAPTDPTALVGKTLQEARGEGITDATVDAPRDPSASVGKTMQEARSQGITDETVDVPRDPSASVGKTMQEARSQEITDSTAHAPTDPTALVGKTLQEARGEGITDETVDAPRDPSAAVAKSMQEARSQGITDGTIDAPSDPRAAVGKPMGEIERKKIPDQGKAADKLEDISERSEMAEGEEGKKMGELVDEDSAESAGTATVPIEIGVTDKGAATEEVSKVEKGFATTEDKESIAAEGTDWSEAAPEKQALARQTGRDCACQSSPPPSEQSCQCCECKDIAVSTSQDTETITDGDMAIDKLSVREATEVKTESDYVTPGSVDGTKAEAVSLNADKTQGTADEMSTAYEKSDNDGDEKIGTLINKESTPVTRSSVEALRQSINFDAEDDFTSIKKDRVDYGEGRISSTGHDQKLKEEQHTTTSKKSSEVPDSVSKLSDNANTTIKDSSDMNKPRKKRSSKLENVKCDCAGVCQCVVCSPEIISKRMETTGSPDPPIGESDQLCCCTIESCQPDARNACRADQASRPSTSAKYQTEAFLRSTNLDAAQGAVPKTKKRTCLDDIFNPPCQIPADCWKPLKKPAASHSTDCECIDCLCLPKIQRIARMKEFPAVNDEKQIFQVTTLKCGCINAVNARKYLAERSRIPIATNATTVGPPKIKPATPAECVCEKCDCCPGDCGTKKVSTSGPTKTETGPGRKIQLKPSELAKLCDCAECQCKVCFDKPAEQKARGGASTDRPGGTPQSHPELCDCSECQCKVCFKTPVKQEPRADASKPSDAKEVSTDKAKAPNQKNCCCKGECTCEVCPTDALKAKVAELAATPVESKVESKTPSAGDDCDCQECVCPNAAALKTPPKAEPAAAPASELSEDCDCDVCACPLSANMKKEVAKDAGDVPTHPEDCDCEICACPLSANMKKEVAKDAGDVPTHPEDCDCEQCVDCTRSPGKPAEQTADATPSRKLPSDCKCEQCKCSNLKDFQAKADQPPKPSSPLECDCVDCECNPCADPKKRKTQQPTSSKQMPCDCTDCECSPCADPSKRKPPQQKPDLEGGDAKVTDDLAGCTCAICQCPGKDTPPAFVKVAHPGDCDCEECLCAEDIMVTASESSHKVKTEAIEGCACVECACPGAEKYKSNVGAANKAGDNLEGCTCEVCICPGAGKGRSAAPVEASGHPEGCTCSECKCPGVNRKQAAEAHPPGCTCDVCCCSKEAAHEKGCTCAECACMECFHKTPQVTSECKCGDCACKECPKMDQIGDGNSGQKVHGKDCSCPECACDDCYYKHERHTGTFDCKCGDCACEECPKIDRTGKTPQAMGPHGKECSCAECVCAECFYKREKPESAFDCKCGDCTCVECPKMDQTGKPPAKATGAGQKADRCACGECVCEDCFHKKDESAKQECKCGVCSCSDCQFKVQPREDSKKKDASVPAVTTRSCHCLDCECDVCSKEDRKKGAGKPSAPAETFAHPAGCTCKICSCAETSRSCHCIDCECDVCSKEDRKKKSDRPAGTSKTPEPIKTAAHAEGCTCLSCLCIECLSKLRKEAPSERSKDGVKKPAAAASARGPNCKCTDCVCEDCGGQDSQAVFESATEICHCSDCKCDDCSLKKSQAAIKSAAGDGKPTNPCKCAQCKEDCLRKGPSGYTCHCPGCGCDDCSRRDIGAAKIERRPSLVDPPRFEVPKRKTCDGIDCSCIICADKKGSSPGGGGRTTSAAGEAPPFEVPVRLPCSCKVCTCVVCNKEGGKPPPSSASGGGSDANRTPPSTREAPPFEVPIRRPCDCGACSCVYCNKEGGQLLPQAGVQKQLAVSGKKSAAVGISCDCPPCACFEGPKQSEPTIPVTKSEKMPERPKSAPVGDGPHSPVHCDCPTCTCPDTSGDFYAGKFESSPHKGVSDKSSRMASKQPSRHCDCPTCTCPDTSVDFYSGKFEGGPNRPASDRPTKMSAKPSTMSGKQSEKLIASQLPCDCPKCLCSSETIHGQKRNIADTQTPVKQQDKKPQPTIPCDCEKCSCPGEQQNASGKQSKKGVSIHQSGSRGPCNCPECDCLNEAISYYAGKFADGPNVSGVTSAISGQVSGKPSKTSGKQASQHPSKCDCPVCTECVECPDPSIPRKGAGKAASAVPSRAAEPKGTVDHDIPERDGHPGSCKCPDCCICPSKLAEIDVSNMDDDTLKQKIQMNTKENCECREQIKEIKKALDKIKCACTEAEMKAVKNKPLVKQASAFGQTMSGLKLALNNLQEKCKAKDKMIDAMTGELKMRTSSNTFDKVLNTKNTDAPDYDRAEDVKSFGMSTNVLYPLEEEKNFAEKLSKAAVSEKTHRNRKKSKTCGCGKAHKEKDNVKLVGFEVIDIRRITQDSIIVKWKSPKSSSVTGYDIYINGVNKSKVMSGGRTSAMIHSLDLSATIQVTIYAVTKCGRCEPPAIAIYEIRP